MIPSKLNKGDVIGVIAPSNYIKKSDLEYINKSIELMENLGLKVKFGKYVFENTLQYGTSPKKRAMDVNQMFENKLIKAIICAKGGEDSNSILDYLDFDIIKNNPKIICGFSDNTSLLNVITSKTNLVTFHGPTFKSLTSWESLYAYNEFVNKLFMGNNEESIEKYININPGKAEGKLIGGNLSLFSKLVSGKYKLDIKNKILFLEELGYESSPEMVNSNIYYLKQNGVFDNISGLWIGNYEHPSKIKLEEIILNAIGNNIRVPIIKSNNFGHIDKKTIIPIGTVARINTENKIKIEYIEKYIK